MWNFEIGLSGLDAARKGLDVIGNNIANAATEGYHRQRVELAPAFSRQDGSLLIGGGVDVEGVTRLIDGLLEKEVLRQQSSLEQVSQEYSTLRSVETAFGELSGDAGLNAVIDRFFNALSELSAHPGQTIWQDQAVTAAETMAGQFRTLGQFLAALSTEVQLQAEQTVEDINALTSQIAELNDNIERIEISGSQANNLRDQRDQLITKLSGLICVETENRDYGGVDVMAAGIPVVMGTSTMELAVGLNEEGLLGITAAGEYNYQTSVEGGRLGGLLALANTTLADIRSDLDDLANTIVQQINRYHVQGLGSAGAFTELTGWVMGSENLSESSAAITDGAVYIRVTNTATGEVTRHQIDIDASADTLTSVAADISAITGLSATVGDSRLSIRADAGYEFDFLPAVLSEPTASDLNGSSPPAISVSGIYTGTENETFTFTVAGTGSVGNGTLELEVTDGSGTVVATLNIGSGYAAGDVLEVGNGIRIAVSTGDFVDGDSFEVGAFANTDTSGFLAAAGMNTLFSANGASDMEVCSQISGSPARIATALGADMTDNRNVLQMLSVRDEQTDDLDSLTPSEFYRRLVTNLGQDISINQSRQESVEAIVHGLVNQQNEISGVDINEEAAQMLVFEQMFQAMAKYLGTVQNSIEGLLELI